MNASGTHTCGIKKSSIHKMWTRIYSLSNNNLNKPYPPKRLQILNSVSRLYEELQMQNPHRHKTIVFRDELLFMTTTLTIFWDSAETLFDDSSAYIYFQIYNDSWIDLCKFTLDPSSGIVDTFWASTVLFVTPAVAPLKIFVIWKSKNTQL